MDMLTIIQRYLRRTGMPATKFGRLAVNDPRLVGDLRNGRELRSDTRARVEDFIIHHPFPPPSAPRGRQPHGGAGRTRRCSSSAR
jgi:hypothetical protein